MVICEKANPTTNQKITHNDKRTRKSPGQIFVLSETQQTRQKTGQEPNTNTHKKKGFAIDTVVFFSSGLADVALRLGPARDVSSERKLYMDSIGPYKNGKSRQKHHKQTTKKPRRPANPPARFAFRHKSSKATRKGQGPTNNTHTRICLGTQ